MEPPNSSHDLSLHPTHSLHSIGSRRPSTSRRPSSGSRRRSWQSRRLSANRFGQKASQNRVSGQEEDHDPLSHEPTPSTVSRVRSRSQETSKWWRVRLFHGMIHDIKRRAPYYWSDWKDAWDYRVVPAIVFMYFANILPALAFSLDMYDRTNRSYGVNEVLLASVLGAVVFSLFAAQPLVIVGVTGPITVFNYTVYDIVAPRGTNFLAFMTWIGIWGLILHWIIAITNGCNFLTYVTRFPCDTFGFYVACVYLEKGVQVLLRQWGSEGATSAYMSIMVALLVLGSGWIFGQLGRSTLFHRHLRTFLEDYGTPITIVFFTGFIHIGRMREVPVATLPVSRSFFPTTDRPWLVHFWDINVGDVFLALPFAVLLTILFYFDHNVSSLIAQGSEFPLKKPAGFHWDFFLLGLTTGVAGILGLPFPNGLIPQAPFHTSALCVHKHTIDNDEHNKGRPVRFIDHVVEQRSSNLGQGLLTLVTMSPPLLIVLHLIPQGVLAGLFFVMGIQALQGNGITQKLIFLAKDRLLTPAGPLKHLERRSAVYLFVILELAGFGATYGITQSIAAIGFPIIIALLIPLRVYLLPRLFSPKELAILDAPTASSFTMESVGGAHGLEEHLETLGSQQEQPTRNSMAYDDDDVFESDDDAIFARRQATDSDSPVEDGLERGELYELRTRRGMLRRRSTTARSANS